MRPGRSQRVLDDLLHAARGVRDRPVWFRLGACCDRGVGSPRPRAAGAPWLHRASPPRARPQTPRSASKKSRRPACMARPCRAIRTRVDRRAVAHAGNAIGLDSVAAVASRQTRRVAVDGFGDGGRRQARGCRATARRSGPCWTTATVRSAVPCQTEILGQARHARDARSPARRAAASDGPPWPRMRSNASGIVAALP